MKKISYFLISLIFLINSVACSGYKPIFITSNLKFKISEYSITGDKKLGNQIYSQLYNLSQLNKDTSDTKNIYVLINVVKNKNATTKDHTGKILDYKINLSVNIIVRDFVTDNQILNENFLSSASYKVQDQYSESIKLENRSIENLINKTYQDLLIKLTEKIQ